ncbi:hypothetical protein PMG11_10741 [Penicillium brasilianum]|uniref:Short chain oxidoreductase/dehydrogenase n=1 Tax=Penicillium brasilianum TaxID=104259 RepID=A0A0F7U3G4_PENBI|nr:hypothetical protein PMG11_10741 [Penicillium brasilianum]
MSAPVWFITGVSGGLGEILARRALSEGHLVIGTCRDKQRSSLVIEPLRDRGMVVIELDVTGTQQYITTKIQEAISIYGHIDILVNNAGYGALGPLERFTEADLMKQMKTNTFGPLYIAQATLPSMRARRGGMIVNVSSYIGIRGDAANGVYAISKFGLEAWSESLSKEVEEFGVSVLVPEFGAFRTKFLDHNVFNQPSKGVVPGYEGSFAELSFDGIKRAGQKQPGDPAKGVEHLFEIILKGGKLHGQKLFRIPIGADAIRVVEDKVARVKADLEIAKALEESDSTLL